VSLSTPVGDSSEVGGVLVDILPDRTVSTAEDLEGAKENPATKQIWESLTPEERLDLKLLSLLECDLGPEDVALLAQTAGRSIIDTLTLLAEVQDRLKRKDEKLSRLRDELDSVWGWILVRQKERQEIHEKILLIETHGNMAGKAKLLARREEREQALAKRYQQKERIAEEIRTYKVTTPYRDIARLLNSTVGTVCSRIFRLRERLLSEFGEERAVGGHVQ
jgi:hypothetical protein